MTVDEAIRALVPTMEVAAGTELLVRELSLDSHDQRRVLFEMICLQFLAVYFAMVHVFGDEPVKVEALTSAYHRYWSTYSDAVMVNYVEEAYRRLSRYREGVRRSEDSGSRLEVGKVFQELCGLPISLASLGTNTFTTVFEHAAAMLIAWDVEFEGLPDAIQVDDQE